MTNRKKENIFFIIQVVTWKKHNIFLVNSPSFSSEKKSVQLALKYPPNPTLYFNRTVSRLNHKYVHKVIKN